MALLPAFAGLVSAQTDPGKKQSADSLGMPVAVLRQLDSATVWEGVRIKTEQVFGEEQVAPSFKIKNKEKRAELIEALEGQFQINVADAEVRSLKRAGELAEYIFRAQQGLVLFSKSGFHGKVERIATDRKESKENGDCLNFIGALIVPKGWKVTFFSQPKFKGAQLSIDATRAEVRLNSPLAIPYDAAVSSTDKSVNWREEVRSIRVSNPANK